MLLDDAGPRLLLSASMFQAVTLYEHDFATFADNMAASSEAEIGAWRVFGVLDWGRDVQDQLPTEPGHIEAIVAVVDALYDAGILTDLCLFGATRVPTLDTIGDGERYARAVCRALRDRRHKLMDVTVGNECGDPAIWQWGQDLSGLQRIVRAIRDELPGVLVGLTAPYALDHTAGSTTQWTTRGAEAGSPGVINFMPKFADGADLVLPHADRAGTWKRAGRQGYIMRRDTEADVVTYVEEFIGPHNYPPGRGPNLNEAVLNGVIASAMWAVGCAAYCFHSGAGIGYTEVWPGRPLWYPLREEPGLYHVAAALAVLPPELPNWRVANWTRSLAEGQVFTSRYEPSDAIDGAPARGHCAADPQSGRFVRHEFGVGQGVEIEARAAMTITVHRRDDRRFTEIDARRLASGERYRLEPAPEYLIVGNL